MILSWLLLVSPRDVKDENGSHSTELTKSKAIGADREPTFRFVVVDASSCVEELGWLVSGWDLLCKAVPYEETSHCRLHPIIQSRILELLIFRGQRNFNIRIAHYWTLDSGRNLMPAASAALATTLESGTIRQIGNRSAGGLRCRLRSRIGRARPPREKCQK